MPATSRRPGPLCDLPLDPFLATTTPLSPFKPGLKRPRTEPSPSNIRAAHTGPFNVDLSISAGQPEKKRRITPTSRKLDFGLSNETHDTPDASSALPSFGNVKLSQSAPICPVTPSAATAAMKAIRLAPSPELDTLASIAKFTGTGDEIDTFFSSPTRPPHVDNLVQTPLAQLIGFANPDPSKMPVYATDPSLSPSSRAMPPPPPLLMPRALPPSPDRTSDHYPGFDIHRDAHVVLPTIRSTTACATPSIPTPHSMANPSGDDEDEEMYADENEPSQEEEDKENLIPPRPRYSRKAATVPARDAAKAGLLLLSPAAKTRASPLRETIGTPRSLAASARFLLSPSRSPTKTPANLKALRRLMEDEADAGI